MYDDYSMIELFPSREVVISVFDWQVRWYGIMYVVAFWSALALGPKLQHYRKLELSREEWTYLVAWAVGGLLVGGRLGYVVLYEPSFFISHPQEILMIWHGGMSSHGGMIGAGITIWYAARKIFSSQRQRHHSTDESTSRFYPFLLSLLDIVSVPAAVGLALGRIGNGINQELFAGNMWMLAVAKDVLIAHVCWVRLRVTRVAGSVFALFLILYGVLRFLIEYIRLQEWPLILGLTRGQLYSIPLVLAGSLLLFWISRRKD